MISKVEEKDWVKGKYETAVILDMTANELAEKMDVTFFDYDTDGLGTGRIQLFKQGNGAQFMFQQLLDAPEPYNKKTQLLMNMDDKNVTEQTLAVLKEVGIKPDQISWVQQEIDRGRLVRGLSSGSSQPPRNGFYPK